MIITNVQDEVMAYLELKEDSQFAYISPKHYNFYITESMEIGKRMAKKYKVSDLATILEENKVAICCVEENIASHTSFSRLQSQIYFTKEQKRIDIFLNAIKEKQIAMKAYDICIEMEDLKILHLAHEFYHFLEFSSNNPTYKQLPTVTKNFIGILPVRSYVTRVNEIAAHQFAKELCSFPFHPKIMDYYYLMYQEAYSETQFNTLLYRAKAALTKEN